MKARLLRLVFASAFLAMLVSPPALLADGKPDLEKTRKVLARKAAAIRSVSATLALRAKPKLSPDPKAPARDCFYDRSGTVSVSRQAAPKAKPAKRSNPKPGTEPPGEDESGKQADPGKAEPPAGEVHRWSVAWQPATLSADCGPNARNAHAGTFDSTLYDGESLYVVCSLFDEGVSVKAAFRHKSNRVHIAKVVAVLDNVRRDMNMDAKVLPEEMLIPSAAVLEFWERSWEIEAQPDSKVGKQPVFVIKRSVKGGPPGEPSLFELFYYSKSTGVLLKAERQMPGGDAAFTLLVNDIKLNKPIPAAKFEFKPPAGVQVTDY